MFHRGVALFGLFTLSPAHATLIEYSVTSTTTNSGGNVQDDFAIEIGGKVAGGFLFADALAPRADDMGNLLTWTIAGDHRLDSRASITYISTPPLVSVASEGGQAATNGYLVAWMEYCLREWFPSPLSNPGFHAANASEWGYGALNRWFGISFVDGVGSDGGLHSGTNTSSVPEPATLSLLGLGVLGTLAARRRKSVADAT